MFTLEEEKRYYEWTLTDEFADAYQTWMEREKQVEPEKEDKGKEKQDDLEDSQSTEEYDAVEDPTSPPLHVSRKRKRTPEEEEEAEKRRQEEDARLRELFERKMKEARDKPNREAQQELKDLKKAIRANEQRMLKLCQRKDPKQSSLAYHKKVKGIKDDRSAEKKLLEDQLEELRKQLFELLEQRLNVSDERKEEILHTLKLFDIMKYLRKYKDAVAPFCSRVMGKLLLKVPLNRIMDTINLKCCELDHSDETIDKVKDILQSACILIKNYRFEL